MKTLRIYLWLIVFVVIIAACNENQPEPREKPDTDIKVQLALIKLSPEMKDYVFVSPIVDSCVVDYSKLNLNTLYYGEGLVLCNPTKQDSILAEFAQSQLKIIGSYPYIVLDNGYAIIDWKWSRFQPLSGDFRSTLFHSPQIYDNKRAQSGYSTNFYYLNGTLANEEYYLLPIKWQELTDLMAMWPMQEGRQISKPEVLYINLEDIEKYGKYQDSYRQYFDENCLQKMYIQYSGDPDNFDATVKKYDSFQAAYVETLNLMIHSNDLDKWTFMYR